MGNPVITEIIAFTNFYPAEESHQKYILKNPDGYNCHFVRNFDFTKLILFYTSLQNHAYLN